MKTGKYEISGWTKFAEEDNFEKGCIGDAQYNDGQDRFCSNTLQGVIDLANRFTGNDDKENILLNSCDEIGRLDVQVMEDENGTPAGKMQTESWKQGKTRLWLVCYTFYVEEVTRKEVDLITAIA